ncbi:RTA1 like protein-domain-containing protein [Leptodontidium sp. 2 PMI_412]|nr:RTA1 like protein-domain-containing protein [Leptodontidium sp. MPI-SDFR-AT-0119]KAH9217561.1 RTA1 like protein-domain-containing protein [Leptodontidium sp. 2 PMI_412]
MSDASPFDDPDVYYLYRYKPSVAVAAVSCALFAVATGVHIFKMYRSRAWFLVPLVLGGLFEVIGFAARAYSATQKAPDWSLGPFIIQSVLTLVAPALFAGSIYMILGRVILMTDGERYSMVRQKWLTKTFVCGDIFAFLLQSAGAGLMSSSSMSKTGEWVVVGGLIFQIIFFGLFVVVAFMFHTRLQKSPTTPSLSVPWRKHLWALYISSALILIRSIFRVVEFVQGNTGYLFRHEVFMYIFDALLMFGVVVLFIFVHPGEIRGYLEREKRASGGEGSEIQLEEQFTRPAK